MSRRSDAPPPLPPYVIRHELRCKYREAADKVRSARTPDEREKWANVMALTISELQHPSFANL